MQQRRRSALILAVITPLLGLAACAPGSGSSDSPSTAAATSVKTDAAGLGQVTLTVWDQAVRGGENAELTQLNAAFQKKYPNIKIKRVSRSFDDLTKTLRLALEGNDAPDVVQANNTRSQMGQFVKAKQLVPLDSYVKAYGWDKRYPQSVRAVASYSPDGKTFGSGSLYGLPQLGEVVGVYANTAKLKSLGIAAPTTWAEFSKALATAKAKGQTPLMLGNLEKWPAVHVFGAIQGQTVPADQIRKLGFGNAGASYTSAENVKAAQTLAEWSSKGYFNTGFNGLGYDPAWQQFSKGKGVFLIGGTWLQADLSKVMKTNVSFSLPAPTTAGGTSYATGASGQPFAITSKAKNPDAAAAYIDFITNADAMKVIAATQNLPVVDTAAQKAPNALAQQVFSAFDTASTKDALLPYLDWATPTMSDTIGATLQDLMAGKATPQQAMQKLQKDYGDFTK